MNSKLKLSLHSSQIKIIFHNYIDKTVKDWEKKLRFQVNFHSLSILICIQTLLSLKKKKKCQRNEDFKFKIKLFMSKMKNQILNFPKF